MRGQRRIHCWSAGTSGVLILRYIGQGTENEITQLDLTYQDRPNLGWCPSKWKAACYKSNDFVMDRFIHSVVSEVTAPRQDKSTSPTINFPPGTWLIDEIEEKQSLVDASGNPIPIELACDTELLDQLRSLQDQAVRTHSDWMMQNSRSMNFISLRHLWLTAARADIIDVCSLSKAVGLKSDSTEKSTLTTRSVLVAKCTSVSRPLDADTQAGCALFRS